MTIECSSLNATSISHSPKLRVHYEGIDKKNARVEEMRQWCGTLTSWQDIAVALLNSQQLLLPAQDPHKTVLINTLSQQEEGLMGPTPL